MNWLDYVFIGIMVLSIIVSLFRGLVREILSLLIWIAAFWLAYHFVDVGANALSAWIELPSARHLIAFVGLFLTALIVGGMINFIVAKLIQKTGLSGTDRFFGMFFGATRGLIAIVAAKFFIQATPLSEDPWWQDSQLVPHFSKISEWARKKMPEDFASDFSFIEKSKVDEMQNLVDALTKKHPLNPKDNAPIEEENKGMKIDNEEKQ